VDGVPAAPVSPYEFTAISGSHTIHGAFRQIQTTVDFTTRQGWNLVSVPVVVADYRRSALFPTAISGAVAYHGAYQVRDTLINGEGYWLKFGTPQTLSLTGGVRIQDTTVVEAGWNLVGSLSQNAAASSVVAVGTTVLTPFYSFAGAYQLSDQLEPTRGYWVKVSTAGSLVLTSVGTAIAAGKAPVNSDLEGLRSITISENSGNEQTLYFGTSPREGFHPERYELPPVPPEGVFDVRFANSGLVAVHPAIPERSEEQRITAGGLQFPVHLQWSTAVNQEIGYAITYSSGGKTLRIRLGKDRGEATISAPDATQFVLRVEPKEIPAEFGLLQNFPNPFNPGTQIEFRIARPGRVRLAIFDQLGREVAVLVNEMLEPGVFQRTFDGSGYASGVYYFRMSADGFTATRRMMLLK